MGATLEEEETMEIKSGEFYRLRANKGYKVKVESVFTRKVLYSRAGSRRVDSTTKIDFITKYEKCP